VKEVDMENVLKMADLLDMGVEKEKARRDFYARVAETFDDEEMKSLFTKLRNWEETHIRKFQAIRKDLDQPDTVESYPGELDAYIRAVVDDRLYQEVSADNFNRNVTDPVEAITYGIQFEKDAILFFMEMARYVQSKNQEVISRLIEEERHHVIFLIKLRKTYT
jgi:rubrerythrin